MPDRAIKGERTFRGIPVSAGVVRGKVLVITTSRDTVPRRSISEANIPDELQRLEQALILTRQEIMGVQQKVADNLGATDANIFDAHLLVLEDPTLLDETTRMMREQLVSVDFAYQQVAEKYAASLESIEDDYLRERAADLRDVKTRVLNNLIGRAPEDLLGHLNEPCIIIAHDLTPSTTAQLNKKFVIGFATEIGSKTSHTAIMARSLQIPAIVGLPEITNDLINGEYVLLDGYNGVVVLNPTEQTLFEYGQLVRKQLSLQDELIELRDKPAITLDGRKVILSANLETPEDVDNVKLSGAEGVGLYRTEYLFINRDALPSEEDQYAAYHKVATALKGQPVVIRTLDLGGDKFLSSLQIPTEMNPFLGWRAIRFCLQELDVFRVQLRAILRASAVGNVKIMYPMISGVEELRQANALLEECKDQLRAEGKAFDDKLEIGAMIEIPSAALAADSLAKRVQFFSLGTNDLIQYSLAVDRMNEKIAHLYEPSHPAILRLIQMTVEAAHRKGLWVGVCGEMAGDPALVPLLLGLGVDELSAAAPLVPQIKKLIRQIKQSEAEELVRKAFECDSGAEIHALSLQLARKVAPTLFSATK
ncbi:MAG TPA: phosphoenolpyruvate--protein phosphotransferase [Verrucomicrobiae bacterium]